MVSPLRSGFYVAVAVRLGKVMRLEVGWHVSNDNVGVFFVLLRMRMLMLMLMLMKLLVHLRSRAKEELARTVCLWATMWTGACSTLDQPPKTCLTMDQSNSRNNNNNSTYPSISF